MFFGACLRSVPIVENTPWQERRSVCGWNGAITFAVIGPSVRGKKFAHATPASNSPRLPIPIACSSSCDTKACPDLSFEWRCPASRSSWAKQKKIADNVAVTCPKEPSSQHEIMRKGGPVPPWKQKKATWLAVEHLGVGPLGLPSFEP